MGTNCKLKTCLLTNTNMVYNALWNHLDLIKEKEHWTKVWGASFQSSRSITDLQTHLMKHHDESLNGNKQAGTTMIHIIKTQLFKSFPNPNPITTQYIKGSYRNYCLIYCWIFAYYMVDSYGFGDMILCTF